eukprot:5998466-Pleurochrysis_carterae.AAC.1
MHGDAVNGGREGGNGISWHDLTMSCSCAYHIRVTRGHIIECSRQFLATNIRRVPDTALHSPATAGVCGAAVFAAPPLSRASTCNVSIYS